jgi:integrase
MDDEERNKPKNRKRRERGVFEKEPGSGAWWVRYADEDGRLHREKVGPKGLALKVYRKRKTEVAERRFFPRSHAKQLTVGEMIEDALKRSEHTANYRNNVHYAELFKSEFGDAPMRAIVPGDIERYAAKRTGEKKAAATLNKELSFLRRVFNLAIADDLLDKSPFRSVKFLKENNQRVRFLSDDEEKRLKGALGRDWEIASLAINTGLRRAELFNLRCENVDFATGLITIPRSKNGELRRVPMNETAKEILRPRMGSEWIIQNRFGRPRNAKNFKERVFDPAVAAAEIDNLRFHDLRHTFASRLVMQGVDLPTVQALMGHKSISMTLRYAHLSPEHQLGAVRKLDRQPAASPVATDPGTAQTVKAVRKPSVVRGNSGGRCRFRTCDPRLVRPMLYH